MKTNLRILEHEDKTSKGDNPKDYTRFKCELDDGTKWMSCFEKDVITDLKNHTDRLVSVEIVQKGDFWNLRKFYGAVAGTSEGEHIEVKPEEFLEPTTTRKPVTGTAYEKDPVGLAIEVFCAITDKDSTAPHQEEMRGAITLVKQAQEAFK